MARSASLGARKKDPYAYASDDVESGLGNMDMGDDELLRGKMQPVNQADDELDIPGSELDDANEDIGEEDEENNYYSLGGDRHEDLDEDNQQEPE
ncbi:MAG: hypothetical protein EOP04_26940 [Proteobacteria bacterium]|nr:MAG: hypothetical protein EOP04_26940 [Pseudomonadota bacterium]